MATILIIDDRPSNREYLVTLLGYGGHRLLEAGDGAEGLATAWTVHCDLVIADILMPTMDGYEFVKQLRADPSLAGTPVIFFTAHFHEQEARALANACGVSHILFKPSEPEVVLRTVDAALGVAPPAAPSLPAEEFDREHLRLLTDKLSQKAVELRSANERLTALVELGLQFGSERDVERLLPGFCHAARQIIGARFGVVGIVHGDGRHLRHFFTSGMDAATSARLGSPDPRQGVLDMVLSECRTRRLLNPGGDPSALGLSASFPPVTSFLAAPIVSPSRVYGWLALINKPGAEEFSPEDERLAGILAAQVGRIYENGSLYADVLRHTTDLEREMAERKHVEQALRENEERFRSAFEDTNVAMVLTDIGNRFIRVNAAFAAMFGYSQEQMLGMTMEDITHPDHLEESHERRKPLLAGESTFFQMEKRYLHRDGHVLWGLSNVALVRDSDGRPMLYVGQVQDITERKRAVEELEAAQQRLQHVISSSPAVLYTLALEGDRIHHIAWMSDNVQDMLGCSPQETKSPTWWLDHIHPEERDAVVATVHHDLFNNNRVANEYRFRHRDGKYRWIRSEIRLLRDAAGNPVEAIGSWSDITERKLLEDQFRQAQKMEAVGRLAGGVAHDFNNLLTVINGYGELLLEELPAGNSSREQIREIVAAGDRASALTRQLLTFSRKAILEPKTLNLGEVVADVDRMLRRIIGEDVQLTVVPEPELGAVKADTGQVEQVILNLAVNARDAMPRGGRLTIELRNIDLDETYVRDHAEARPGPHVLLAVSDTGIGMDQETMTRIFEPFFSTKGEKGTGLGLATVHGIVKQSGGHIGVYSELGRGTTFKIYLPRVGIGSRSSRAITTISTMPRGSETILLVEDEDGVRALTRHVLQSCGYTVLEARDGVEGVQIAEQHSGRIDLLITDVVMPRMGGREVAERLSAKHGAIEVLYLSGYTDDAVVRHGILEAEVAFLQKPFSPASLAAKVREVLDSR